jgi:phage baseplate assembly protein W
MSFKFKSSGKKQTDLTKSLEQNPIIYGIKFPFEFDTQFTFLKCNIDPLDQITDDLKNLILTNYGERIGRYDYGANLRPLLTELSEEPFEDAASINVLNAVKKWMPFVTVLDLKTTVDNESSTGLSILNLKITFTVKQISQEIRTLNFIVKLIG